nr:uncharacterized mitochondrial protein AtMg00810-like [Tanacetum cinerariifolium]
METHKPISKDSDGADVDVNLYRSMIGSLMYIISSRPDIMFDVCACSRFQVQPKVSHMHVVKKIFRYLKGYPTLGCRYPKDLPLELIAYSDSDYAGASLDKKSTTGGCQFLGSRLISWRYKKQTIMANSTTESEYIAASNCYGQVLWLQNQILDYGYFLNDGYADLVQHADKKELAIPGQTETGKEFSNPLMAGSLPKTISAKFVDQHNMVAYLEKNDDNTEFHQIVDFLSTAVVISESLVRRDHLFDDEDGITCLTNDEIFENLALMGYEPLSTKLTFQKDEAVNQEEGDKMERTIDTDARVKKLESQLKPKISRAVIPSSDEEGPSETVEHLKDDDDDETLAETLLNINRSLAKDKGKGIMQETKLPKKLKKKEMIQLSFEEELAQSYMLKNWQKRKQDKSRRDTIWKKLYSYKDS